LLSHATARDTEGRLRPVAGPPRWRPGPPPHLAGTAGHDLAPEQEPAKFLCVDAPGHALLDDDTKIVEAAEGMFL
jgi:hypothetical protein